MNADILFFFNGHMDALPLYERLEELILEQIPDVKIKVSKTQISFSNKRGFAFVSFNPSRKAKERPDVWMTVTFGLSYRKDSLRIDVANRALPEPLDPPCDGRQRGRDQRRTDGLDSRGGRVFCP